MQNSHEFEERIINAKRKIAAIVGGERAGRSGTYLQHAAYLTANCQRNHPAAKGRQPLNRKERAAYSSQIRPVEELVLRDWAISQDLWLYPSKLDAISSERFLDAGAEQQVYLSATGTSVVKVNSGVYHGTWLEFFLRLLIHRSIFPSTHYSLLAFTEMDSSFAAVLTQPFVDILTGADNETIANYLLPLGFAHLRHQDYYHRQQGLILEDLHDENVFVDEQGVLYFIDPVIYLETPDLGLHGPSQFTFPFAK